MNRLATRSALIYLMVWGLSVANVSLAQSGRPVVPADSGNLSIAQVDTILERFYGQRFDDFADFVLSVYSSGQSFLTASQLNALANFSVHKKLSGKQREVLFRVLGVYAQLKYGGDSVRLLERLVEIPTAAKPNRPQHKNPNIIDFGKLLKNQAKQSGLVYRNIDNRVFEISIPTRAKSGPILAYHSFADVVVQERKWVVEGVVTDPFSLTRVGNKMVGLGARQGKSAIAVMMYALRVIAEENISALNRLKLLVDTTHKSSRNGISYYVNQNQAPAYNILLEGGYSVATNHIESRRPQLASNQRYSDYRWVNALLTIAGESLGNELEFKGDYEPRPTSVLPRALRFGFSALQAKESQTVTEEYKDVNEFLHELRVITESMARLGQMKELD